MGQTQVTLLPVRRRRRWVWLLVAAVALLVVFLVARLVLSTADEGLPTSPSPRPKSTGFVVRDGTQLKIDGKPVRFVGFNSYVLFSCGRSGEKISPDRWDAFFAGLRPGGLVRIPMLLGTPTSDMDRLVAAAGRHDQRLVIVLSDQHGDCGESEKDDAFYSGGYRGAFLDWVRTVVPRYRDDPTVAMWELVNEPRADDLKNLRAFFDAAGGLVHELDPHHLLSAGTLQPEGLGGVNEFAQLMASPAIDVVSLHEYDAKADVSPHLASVLTVARQVGKPVLVGEWGLYAGPEGARHPDGEQCFSVDGRAAVGGAKVAAYLAVPEVAGLLYWSYTADGVGPSDSTCKLSTTRGDPLVDMIRNVAVPVPES